FRSHRQPLSHSRSGTISDSQLEIKGSDPDREHSCQRFVTMTILLPIGSDIRSNSWNSMPFFHFPISLGGRSAPGFTCPPVPSADLAPPYWTPCEKKAGASCPVR